MASRTNCRLDCGCTARVSQKAIDRFFEKETPKTGWVTCPKHGSCKIVAVDGPQSLKDLFKLGGL